MSAKSLVIAAMLCIATAAPVLARPSRSPQAPATQPAAPNSASSSYGRPEIYSTPLGHQGIIQWNTGDRNGNLGIQPSPGGGGGA